jgi:pyruvate/2-oxoglutarate/acetoin dehydrogenase E1 component
MLYYDQLCRSMEYLAEDKRTIFMGQAVAVKGTAVTTTLKDIAKEKLLEFPVAEEFQMGAAIGLALAGLVPITIYPRFNFLLLAMNQLVNHLDKMQELGGYTPKVIIRTVIGSIRPLNPQCQHRGDFTEAVARLCPNISVLRLDESEDIFPAYKKALEREDGKSSLLIEWGDFYSEK